MYAVCVNGLDNNVIVVKRVQARLIRFVHTKLPNLLLNLLVNLIKVFAELPLIKFLRLRLHTLCPSDLFEPRKMRAWSNRRQPWVSGLPPTFFIYYTNPISVPRHRGLPVRSMIDPALPMQAFQAAALHP